MLIINVVWDDYGDMEQIRLTRNPELHEGESRFLENPDEDYEIMIHIFNAIADDENPNIVINEMS